MSQQPWTYEPLLFRNPRSAPIRTNQDPFQEARQKEGVLPCEFQGETVPMILRHADVRQAARDWKTFSSDAPFRVPIPSEEDVWTMPQLPIETNPPERVAGITVLDSPERVEHEARYERTSGFESLSVRFIKR